VTDGHDKGLSNEKLPDPTRVEPSRVPDSPRTRTAEHLKQLLAAGLALQLAAGAACRSTGYLVVDPVPPPPPPRNPAPTGFLALTSIPVADISIDGRPTGLKTPQMKIELTSGTHTITLAVSGTSLTQTFTVDITTGVTTTLERVLGAGGR
jgi:hypothetical protein